MDLQAKTTDYQNKIIEQINSSNDENAISLILELRDNGGLYLVNTFLNILLSNRSETLKRTVIETLTDIKDLQAAKLYVEFLKKNYESKKITDVLTICWQSRLDFTENIDIFFDILCKSDYQTAFEAFTVIENNLDSLTVEQLSNYIALVKSNVSKTDRDKQLLLLEMVSTLDKAKRTAS
jgi:hypothetical protein